AGLLEQPGHTLAADADAGGAQIAMDARRAIGAARRSMEVPDPIQQLAIVDASRALGTILPRIVPASGDAQDAAHGGKGMGGPIRLHESESFDGIDPVSRANQAAAFFKISRSSRSVAFSRRSRCSS